MGRNDDFETFCWSQNSTSLSVTRLLHSFFVYPMWAREHCRISPPHFLWPCPNVIRGDWTRVVLFCCILMSFCFLEPWYVSHSCSVDLHCNLTSSSSSSSLFGMHHQCIAPLAANSLHSSLFRASSIASSKVRLCWARSFFRVAIQEV